MPEIQPHIFHIPVMGLGFTIDTPVRVARFGISSVVSIIEDELVEQMREILCHEFQEEYDPITSSMKDHRANRISAFLDLMNRIVKRQMDIIRAEEFIEGNDIVKYFEMLDDRSPLKKLYVRMISEKDEEKQYGMQRELRDLMSPGRIDVNIMTKTDREVYDRNGEQIPGERSNALTALEGFANSSLDSSVVFSAGLNPRLYNYCATFADFFPDANGVSRKKIILKVSDFRSASIQGKILAKKGLWISEFRIESGLNCGGHAFASECILLGPVLEEFRTKRKSLTKELFGIYADALTKAGSATPSLPLPQLITVQGGIGTAEENRFLLEHYGIEGTGWGSPFLLVPEVTNVDKETLDLLANAEEADYYLSESSPLGVPFNNFRKSSSQRERERRILKNRPGSPCYKKFLAFNTEFTKTPICESSREYQSLKIKQLIGSGLDAYTLEEAVSKVTEKECLCEGLGASALLKNDAEEKLKVKEVAICPGPNLAYFSGTYTLREMVDHIYGRTNILRAGSRPHMFVKELQLNVEYLKKQVKIFLNKPDAKLGRVITECKSNLLKGIEYYKQLPITIFGAENNLQSINDLFDEIASGIRFLAPQLTE